MRGAWPWCRCRAALPRHAYRRTLAAHRGPELGATLGRLPDPPRGLRRVATRVPGARCCRACLVRLAARLNLSLNHATERRVGSPRRCARSLGRDYPRGGALRVRALVREQTTYRLGGSVRRLTRYEAAAFTSATTFFSTAEVHSVSAYDVGHIGPSSRLAASSNPSVA